jgi:hypothetical protein
MMRPRSQSRDVDGALDAIPKLYAEWTGHQAKPICLRAGSQGAVCLFVRAQAALRDAQVAISGMVGPTVLVATSRAAEQWAAAPDDR